MQFEYRFKMCFKQNNALFKPLSLNWGEKCIFKLCLFGLNGFLLDLHFVNVCCPNNKYKTLNIFCFKFN